MADEGERVGGIYVDVGIDDEGVLARLNAIEAALTKLARVETTVRVKLVEEGSTTSTRARKTPTVLPATLQLEKDAAKKALKSVGPLSVEVGLTLANDAVSKLKAQITEAFQNFSIKVNVEYGGASGTYSPSMAQEEFAEATGLAGGGQHRTKRVTRSFSSAQSAAPTYDRFYAVAHNSQQLEIAKQTLATLRGTGGSQGTVNRAIGLVNQLERRINILSHTPAGTLAEEQPGDSPLLERARRFKGRAPFGRKNIIARPVSQAAMAAEIGASAEYAYPSLPTSTATGSRYRQYANDDPQLAAIEARQRRADRESAMLSGRSSGEPGSFAPRDRAYRSFDRTSLTGRGRRRGPTRAFGGPNPSRGFFDPFAPNRVGQVIDENSLGFLDPAAYEIMNAYRRGEFGTSEEPLVSGLNQEGRRTGALSALTAAQRKQISRAGGSTGFGQTFGNGRFQVMSPKNLANERLQQLGELPPLVRQKIDELFANPKYRPGSGIVNGGGGYVGVSRGAGGAARSALDTPEGNRASRERIRNERYREAFRSVEATNPELAAAIRAAPEGQRQSMLEAYLSSTGGDIVEQRALRAQSPREFGFQPRVEQAFGRYQRGYAGTAGIQKYMDVNKPVTPASTYHGQVRKLIDQFKSEFNYGPRKKLPEAFLSQLGAYSSKIKETEGYTTTDFDKFIATGGVGRRFVPGSIEEAAARLEPPGRATTTSRPSRRTYTPEEEALAENEQRIRAIMGSGRRYAIERGRTPESRRAIASGSGVRKTQEELIGELQGPLMARGGGQFQQRERGQIGMTASLGLMDELSGRLRFRESQRGEASFARFIQEGRGGRMSGAPIISDKTPLSGDALIEKIAGKATVGRAIRAGTTGRGAAGITSIAGAAPTVEELRASVAARIQQAAEESAPSIGGGGGGGRGRTALAGAMGGGPVPVRVVNFAELKGIVLTGGGGGGIAKASEEEAPKVAGAPKVDPFVTRARQRTQLLATLQRQGLAVEEARPEGRPYSGKSPARIQAESEILEARALSPTRAFQTAVAAAFAKTIGGGGAFERRVKGLTGALGTKADISEEVSDTGRELVAIRKSLANVRTVTDELSSAGKPIPETLVQWEASIQADRKETIEKLVGQRSARATAGEDVAARRRGLISLPGVVRGFAALGVGAITGGLIFSAASQAIQAILGVLEDQASKAADALGGFALTASRVTSELASSIRQSLGDRGAIGGAAAPSGISLEALQGLNGQGLTSRAEAIAAAQARVQESDLFRAGNFLGQDRLPGGFDKALFQGTGGVLNTQLFAPQPGLMERVSDDLSRSIPTAQLKSSNPIADFLGLGNGPSAGTGTPGDVNAPEIVRQVTDLNSQLTRVNSGFRYLTDATVEQKDAMKKSADQLGQGNIADKLINAGIAITGQGGRELTGTEFGQAAADLAKGQLTVDPRVAFEADKRGMEAQLNQIKRQFDHEMNFTLPSQLSLGGLAAPLAAPGTGMAAANPAEQKQIEASVKSTGALQEQLNQRYQAGNKILQQALPKDLYDSIESTGKQIVQIQSDLANSQAALQAHEYSNQLKIAERTYHDILGLQGKSAAAGASQLGIAERQNVELSRQSELLSQQLSQRQINFQLAQANFQAPGLTSEQRAANIEQAQYEAGIAQKQLDLQKKQFGNNVKIFDLQNVNAAVDALNGIKLLKEGRGLVIKSKDAEEKLLRLQKLQDDNVNRAGKYLGKVESEIAVAYGELAKLEATYGEALDGITKDTIDGFISTIDAMYTALGGGGRDPHTGLPSNNGAGIGTTSDQNGPRERAAGALFNTSGATSMIVGEAGTETVAVLRNPRMASLSAGGGGGGITININGPVVNNAGDIQKMARAVEQVLQRKASLVMPRRP